MAFGSLPPQRRSPASRSTLLAQRFLAVIAHRQSRLGGREPPSTFEEGLACRLQGHRTNRARSSVTSGSRRPERITGTSYAKPEDGTEVMKRALRIVKMVGRLLAIEIFVPGGTLIVLAMLLTSRSRSPLARLPRQAHPGAVTSLAPADVAPFLLHPPPAPGLKQVGPWMPYAVEWQIPARHTRWSSADIEGHPPARRVRRQPAETRQSAQWRRP